MHGKIVVFIVSVESQIEHVQGTFCGKGECRFRLQYELNNSIKAGDCFNEGKRTLVSGQALHARVRG